MASARQMARYLAATARNPAVLSPRKQYLLILSHMRSHTSLLSHILGSHPDITGHSEMHQGYSNSLDLLKLRCKVSIDNANTLRGRFVLDKVLNDYPLSPRILAAPSTQAIFLLRKPDATLKSILAMGRRYAGVDWHRDPRKVLAYYTARLSQLERLATTRAAAGASPAFFFDSELLLERTGLVLRELTRWLGLTGELSPHYRIFETTGRPGWGDPSDIIKAARVMKPDSCRDEVELEPGILEEATPVFARCRNTLLALCRGLRSEAPASPNRPNSA
jgi:hypothetical protein